MKRKIVPLIILSLSFILISCSEDDSNPLNSNKQYDWEGEVGKYNTAYWDSVLFTSTRYLGTSFAPNIYIMSKDGNGIRALTNEYFTFGATYSPRRLKIIFVADTSYSTSSRVLYSMDVNGTNKKIISQPGEDVWAVACSPDGSMIAYIVLESSKGKIRVLNTKDNSVNDVTGLYGYGNFKTISWSSDSKKIVFDGMSGDRIGIANADGSGYSELFYSSQGCYFPRYSPDGRLIAFSSFSFIDGEYYSNIFIYDVIGQTYRAITNIKGFSYDPCWARDNKTIIFASRGIGDAPSYLFKVDVNTKEVIQITNGSGSDWGPYFW